MRAPVHVAVVDHGMGNLRSVCKALERAGASARIAGRADEIRSQDALCVPGQGVFGRCMTALSRQGRVDLIREWVTDGRPYLGICLGMQVLFERSAERGPFEGLGLLEGEVTRLPADVRVPHIGWNDVADDLFYFDHSYAVHPRDETLVDGWCEHGERFAARISKGALLGVQFHPEKSGRAGLALLTEWVGSL